MPFVGVKVFDGVKLLDGTNANDVLNDSDNNIPYSTDSVSTIESGYAISLSTPFLRVTGSNLSIP